jgi:hypothetical protein
MKRASYREAVAWIADNDEPGDHEVASIAGYISTLLVADLFRLPPVRVAADILRKRLYRHGRGLIHDEATRS